MSKANLLNSLNRAVHKVGFKIKKHSPEILIVAGTVGVVTSGVMACKATTKLDTILDKAKSDVEAIHTATEKGEVAGVEYSKEDGKKDLTIVYAKTGVELIKLYAPAVAVGTLSLACIISSNNILRKRNVALAAAYATVDKSFKEYRGRVVERFGEELDKELKYNIRAREVEETVVDDEGKETVVKKTVQVGEPSEYAKFFDEYCAGWDKNADYNLTFLRMRQAEANKRLQENGMLFLNEVYDMLGIDRTKAGQIVGWIYDPKDDSFNNYVDFGIYNICNEGSRDFVNGRERSILLDFNVDGDIYSLMQ